MQHRNATSLPLFSKRRNGKSGRKARNDFRLNDKMTPACRNYTKTMDDCKRYLKELHDSNKNLGLVSSSSEISNESSVKNVWSDTQHQKSIEPGDLIDLSESPREARTSKPEEEENSKIEANKIPRNTEEPCLELSNAIYPVLQLLDKRLLSSKMNIQFCADVFPQPAASNVLIPVVSNERGKFTPSTREALYQVKKKLESLHNVLRSYELQSIATTSSKAEENNAKRAQNLDTLVPITKEDYDWTKAGKSNGNFNNDFNKQTSNSSEQCESDETGRSSIVSFHAYSNMFNNNYRVNNVNEPYCLLMEKTEPNRRLEIIPNNRIIYSSGVKCEKIPERIYYAISSESFEDKGIKRAAANFATLPKTLVENQSKEFGFREQFSAPMETDDDVIVSPTSSRTELSKDSELEDKPTAILLQEALQFKQALLTRVELEKVCLPQDEKEETSDESAMLEQSKYSYVNNNLQTKFLDIISEEQSISSSTEKTSRTYMFFNLKQDKLLNFTQQQISRDSSKRFLESKENLEAPSEYFSFSNVNQEANADNTFNRTAEKIASNVRVKHLDESLEESDDKLLKFASCLNATQMDLTRDFASKKESFDDPFNFIDRNINSVELFSQDLDEAPLLEDKVENTFTKSPKVAKKNLEDSFKIDALNDDKYLEDNEIACNPNLILKRNLGAYSLIEQTLLLGPDKRQMHSMIMNDETIYDVSASESKETSVETNLIQDSTTSSFNQSNDSNIPETVLMNKSLDEEKLKDLNWREANVSHDFIGEKDAKTCSTNTITLQKYDATKMDNYRQNDDNVASERNSGMEENSFTNFAGESNEAAEFYKSIYNLISPHSSVYFTDEASSSATKLNNAHSKNHKGLSRNDREDKSRYNGENFKERQSNVININDKSCNDVCIHENFPEANNEMGCDKNNGKENADLVNETETRKKENDTRSLCNDDYNNLSTMGNVSREKTPFNSPRSNAERLSLEQYLISPNSSPREATRKSNATMKSKSHESYDKSKKSTQPNVKGLKSDGANIAQPKMESNMNSIFTKLQDVSEFRHDTEESIKLDKKRSKSQVSFRMEETCAESLDSKLKLRTHLKSLSPTPKTSSRSCIPILKSRLEAARRSESESRPKSPVRGPLTMTMCWRDNLCEKDQTMTEEIQVEGKSRIVNAPMEESAKDSVEKANDDGNHKQDTLKRSQTQTIGNELGQQEQMVIYVNIFTKYDRNSTKIVDPNKFLEFVKNRKLSSQKFSGDKKEIGEVRESPENEKDTMHKIVTVVSSVINGNELDETTSSNLSKMQNDSLSNSLLNGRLKNVCLLSVEQREIDVTAKPSVIDTSTSISDLETVSGGGRNKFQICGTPKELNNEEYIALLEILHQEPNFVHLEELQNVCKKLVSEYPKI